MSKCRKIIMTALVCILAVQTTGCGEKMPDTAAEAIEVINKKADEADQVDAAIEMNMSFESLGNRVTMKTTSDLLFFKNPYKLFMNISMDMGEEGQSGMELYLAGKDDKYFIYQRENEEEWKKQQISKDVFENRGEAYCNQANLSAYISDSDTFKIEKTDDKKKVALLKGVVKGESLKKLLEQSGMADNFAGYEIDNLDEKVFDSLEDASVEIEVDTEKVQIKKLTFDMSGVMESLMNMVMESAKGELTEEDKAEKDDLDYSVKVSECTMTITYHSFEKIKDFEIPKEAEDAKETDLGF